MTANDIIAKRLRDFIANERAVIAPSVLKELEWIVRDSERAFPEKTCETCRYAVRDHSGRLWCGDAKDASMCSAIRYCGLWEERT